MRLWWLGDGTGRLTWRDLLVIAKTTRKGSVLYDSLRPPHPDDRWTTEAQLLAVVIDAIQWSNYLLARLGGNNRAKEPEPFPRPGVAPDPGDVSLKGTPRTIEEMNRILNWTDK